jgi:CcmD family protein
MIAASTLPDNTGYVAAAYLVVFALILIYLAIMANKLSRLDRELTELNELEAARPEPVDPEPAAAHANGENSAG